MHHAFLYISLPSLHDYHVKMPNFTFCEGQKQAMIKFYFSLWLDMVDGNSAPEEFACIWQSKQVGIIMIETEKRENSWIFKKAWSMQEWTLVVSSSLYFWKSVFSFRVASILTWRVYIKLKVSLLRRFLWCMSQKSRDRVNSRRVRTHEENSGETVRRLGTIMQNIFCAQSGASIRLTSWKWSGESRYQGAFPPVLKMFLRAFSPDPTDRPWVSKDAFSNDCNRLGTDRQVFLIVGLAARKNDGKTLL